MSCSGHFQSNLLHQLNFLQTPVDPHNRYHYFMLPSSRSMSSTNTNVSLLSHLDFSYGTVYNPSGSSSELGSHQSMSTYANVPHLPATEPFLVLNLLSIAKEVRTSSELLEETDITDKVIDTDTYDLQVNIGFQIHQTLKKKNQLHQQVHTSKEIHLRALFQRFNI